MQIQTSRRSGPGPWLGLEGKTVLVCSASSGIGRACASALAEAGVDVIALARNADALDRLADEFATEDGTCRALAVDVIDVDAVRAALASPGWTPWSTARPATCRNPLRTSRPNGKLGQVNVYENGGTAWSVDALRKG